MRFVAVTFFAMIMVAAASCVRQGEPANDASAAGSERSLVGQVLLPGGNGSRGVEVVVSITGATGEPVDTWLLFDEQGRFAHTFRGSLTRLTVSTGLRAELHRIDTEDLPEMNREGRIDLGVIDLRDQLTKHRLVLRVAEGALPGEVRVAMCFGLPPVGPEDEPVSLGSRQFPPVALGSAVDWLLPHDATSVYFLVERPVRSGRGQEWRGGHQRLFGPFTSATLPAELMMD